MDAATTSMPLGTNGTNNGANSTAMQHEGVMGEESPYGSGGNGPVALMDRDVVLENENLKEKEEGRFQPTKGFLGSPKPPPYAVPSYIKACLESRDAFPAAAAARAQFMQGAPSSSLAPPAPTVPPLATAEGATSSQSIPRWYNDGSDRNLNYILHDVPHENISPPCGHSFKYTSMSGVSQSKW